MRFAITIACLVLASCSTAMPPPSEEPSAPSVSPVRATARGSFDGTAQATFHPDPIGNSIPPIALTPLFRVMGRGVVVGQPFPPYLIFDGDASFVVEPMPGREAEAFDAVSRGWVLIRREGRPGLLHAPGTADALRARRSASIPPEASATAETIVEP